MIYIIKSLIEGLCVSLIVFILYHQKLTRYEIILLGVIATITYIIIDRSAQMLTAIYSQEMIHAPEPVPKHAHTEPIPSALGDPPYTEISNIKSRWMKWTNVTKPINKNTQDYMLYPGTYASLHIRPGFRDDIVAVNHHFIEKFAQINHTITPMIGGGGGGDDVDVDVDVASKTLPISQSSLEPRLNNVVYSGDLIELISGDNIIQRATNNSQLLLDKPLPNIRTNLSKLRFENQLTDGINKPIKYRDNICIKHNALINNVNQIRSIKYGERLQSHQTGPTYEVFKLFKKDNHDSNDYVKYGDQFVIACGDQEGDKIYLKVESDHSISSEASQKEAITFIVNLLKPYSNLCVCPNETIYP